MRRIWDSYDDAPFTDVDLQGLKRLKKTVSEDRAGRVSRTFWPYAIACGLSAVMFAAGYLLSSRDQEMVREVSFITAEGSFGDHLLPDGSRVRLNSDSKLTYVNDLSGNVRKVRLEGEGYFEVSKDVERPFVVQLGNIDVQVLGTSFDACSYPGSAEDRVILKSGSVRLTDHNGDSPLMMQPGDMVVYNRYEGDFCKTRVNARDICRWYETRLEFNASRLGDVLFNIGDRYRVNIEFKSKCSLDSRLSMTIEREPLEQVLGTLSSLFPIRYERLSDDRIIITDKNKK